MISGIVILEHAIEGAWSEPGVVAASHPSWERDLGALGPLTHGELELGDGQQASVLRADLSGMPDVLVVAECATTMELAARLAGQGVMPPWGAVVAVRQQQGRGQMRRPWTSPAGNLHVSFLLPPMEPDNPFNRLLPLVIGQFLSDALDELGAPVSLKWPNDLVQGRAQAMRKTCGLLIEDRGGQVVCGLGVNLAAAPKPEQMRAEAAFPAGKLMFEGEVPGPLGLWQKLVNRLKKDYGALLDNATPDGFVRRLSERLLWLGEEVRLKESTGDQPVRILGLDTDGGLRIFADGSERTIYSGSIYQS